MSDHQLKLAAWADQPVNAYCHGCGHHWPAAYAPMSLAKLAALLSRADMCPVCGSDQIFAGPKPTSTDAHEGGEGPA